MLAALAAARRGAVFDETDLAEVPAVLIVVAGKAPGWLVCHPAGERWTARQRWLTGGSRSRWPAGGQARGAWRCAGARDQDALPVQEWAHDDGGAETAFRVYPDHGFCFACGEYFTPVKLCALAWDCTPDEAARQMLELAGVADPDYREQWQRLVNWSQPADVDGLASALRVWCAEQTRSGRCASTIARWPRSWRSAWGCCAGSAPRRTAGSGWLAARRRWRRC